MLGSDGVWDNVFDEEINAVCESVVQMGLSGGALAAQIARSVAEYASTNAHDKSSVSPFYARYNRIRCGCSTAVPAVRCFDLKGGIFHCVVVFETDCSGRATSGGKPDDITVVAAVVANNSKL